MGEASASWWRRRMCRVRSRGGVGSESRAQVAGTCSGRWPIRNGHRCEHAAHRSSMSGDQVTFRES